MTLTRPEYAITVENVSKSWSMSVTQGDVPDPDTMVELHDGLSIGWTTIDELAPAQTIPDVAKFRIWVRHADAMPALDEGDKMIVTLVRPTETDPIVYAEVIGRVTDLSADTSPADKVVLSVTVVDPVSDLVTPVDLVAETFYQGSLAVVADFAGNELDNYWAAYRVPLVPFTYRVLPAGGSTWGANTAVANNAGEDDAAVGDLLRKMLNTCGDMSGDRLPILRTAQNFYEEDQEALDVSGDVGEFRFNWHINTDYDDASYLYYAHPWRNSVLSAVPIVLELVADVDDPDMLTVVDAAPAAAASDSAILLDGSVVAAPLPWRKSRAQAINLWSLKGYEDSPSTAEATYTYRDAGSIITNGPNVRTIETYAIPASAPNVIKPFINPSPSPAPWTIEGVDVLAQAMDDDQLDHLAGMFYPHAAPHERSAPLGRYVILHDIADRIMLGGNLVIGQLVGAEFKINGGHLRIAATIAPTPLRLAAGVTAPGVTWTEMKASAWSTAAWHDNGGKYIDPTLTWDELKLTDL